MNSKNALHGARSACILLIVAVGLSAAEPGSGLPAPLDETASTGKEVTGTEDAAYAASVADVALYFYRLGDYPRAGPLLRRSIALLRDAVGPEHPDYVIQLSNLAAVDQAQGDYAAAELLLQEALRISEQTGGRRNPNLATNVSNLAGLYQTMGDYARAAPLLEQAVQIAATVQGENSLDYATALNNLAGLYYVQNDYERAELLFRQVLEIRRQLVGADHPDYATSLNNLAGLRQSKGDYAEAERLYRQALEIRRAALGSKHPDCAVSLNNLGTLYRSMGAYAKADDMYQQALDLYRDLLGPTHPNYALTLNNRAVLYRSLGEHEKAAELHCQALDIAFQALAHTFAVLSERQQLAMAQSLRYMLDAYLSTVARAGWRDARVYDYVLAWKGMVFVWQRQSRLHATQPELAPLLSALQSASSRLAMLHFTVPEPDQKNVWQQQMAQLSKEKERLEAELARRSTEFRESKARPASHEVRAALPPGTALVDYLEYAQSLPQSPGGAETEPTPHLMAVVVRPDCPPAYYELGPTRPIEEAIGVWRKSFGKTSEASQAAKTLRDKVWRPVEADLEGVRTVLVSPDGALSQFPLAALPGKEPDHYLLEELALAVVPVPQSLPEMLAAQPATPAGEDGPAAALMILGDVDYDATGASAAKTGVSPVRGRSSAPHFYRLENTRGEMLTVRDTFESAFADGHVRLLRGQQATKAALSREAPDYRFLHLATHGFFADPSAREKVSGTLDRNGPESAAQPRFLTPVLESQLHPGLLCGLALAGANHGSLGNGILTAEEVTSLRLDGVELAVLSACDTALGATAGGEGVLGLQRAFQVAGARSVVASLWTVNDEATRTLMERFYENLWGKKRGKLESLREAQLWMLQEGRQRGLALIKEEGPSQPPARTPPFYWAAFVLSGDWR